MKNWRLNALHTRRSMGKCDKCNSEAKIRSVVNGEIKYQLCKKCYSMVGKKKKKNLPNLI